jgi:hypothetical protein
VTHTVILLDERRRDFAKRLVASAPPNYVVTVKEQKRTGEQNALFWALLTDLSVAKPNGRMHTPDVWKLLVMHACGHAAQFEMGLNGQPFPVGFRSSELTKGQMSDLIEWIYAYAAEAGVRLGPQP